MLMKPWVSFFAWAWLALPAVVPQVLAQTVPSTAAVAVGPDDLALVGVVTTAGGARSSAVLRTAGRARVVGVGDSVGGARVAAIGAAHVVLEVAGRTRELRFGAAPPAPVALAPVAPAAPGTPQEHEFARADVERRIATETPRLLSETALVPVTDNGQVNGFTLARVPEGSLLTELGLRAGDVLTEINGTRVDSMATLLALYGRLRNESEIRAVVLRGGSAVPLVLRLR